MAQKNEAAAHALPRRISMERARGIEPPSLAWEADILPMNYARVITDLFILAWMAGVFKQIFGAFARSFAVCTFSDFFPKTLDKL